VFLLLVACSDPYGALKGRPEVEVDTGDPTGDDNDPPEDTVDTGEPQPLDSDGDGWPDDDDCVPDDATVYPGAAEVWYDGVDQDCLGDSDYDQDHDGFLAAEIGGDDCLDTRADVYPGAPETWYDGLDGDCAGDDDFDQDGDGDPVPGGAGDDCDDEDPTVSSLAEETLDDGIDGDCNGDPDGFRFSLLDLSSASGLQGPRIAGDSAYVMIAFMADSYEESGTIYAAAGLAHYLSADEPSAGSVGMSSYYWGSDYEIQGGMDFWADDDYQAWAYGLQYGSTRYLLVDVYQASTGLFRGTGWSYPTSKPFADVELTAGGDGSLHVVGCDEQLGFLTWMHATPDGFLGNTDVSGDDASDADSTACVLDLAAEEILAGQPGNNRTLVYKYFDEAGLAYDGADPGWTAYDIETEASLGQRALAVAEGSRGVLAQVDGSTQRLSGGGATAVDITVGAAGNAYVVYADGSGEPWLAWGRPGAMNELQLDTDLAAVDDVDLYLTTSMKVVVAARAGNRAVVGVVGL